MSCRACLEHCGEKDSKGLNGLVTSSLGAGRNPFSILKKVFDGGQICFLEMTGTDFFLKKRRSLLKSFKPINVSQLFRVRNIGDTC